MKSKKQARIRRGLKTKIIQRRNLDRPRLVVNRSSSHIYSQIVICGKNGDVVLACSSSLDRALQSISFSNKIERASQVGKLLAERALSKEIGKVCFDRSGYKYHGRIKALADSAREAGLNF